MWGELCRGERIPHGMMTTLIPEPLGHCSGLEVSKVPATEEIQISWSLLAFGFELGGRSGRVQSSL